MLLARDTVMCTGPSAGSHMSAKLIPQPAIVQALADGLVLGRVVVLGCETGTTAMIVAKTGHTTVGVTPKARDVTRWRAQCRQHGSRAQYVLANPLDVNTLPNLYDTVIDVGLFHRLDRKERQRYVQALGKLVVPGGRVLLLCVSDLEEDPGVGIYPIPKAALPATFTRGWRIQEVLPTQVSVAGTLKFGWRVRILKGVVPAVPGFNALESSILVSRSPAIGKKGPVLWEDRLDQTADRILRVVAPGACHLARVALASTRTPPKVIFKETRDRLSTAAAELERDLQNTWKLQGRRAFPPQGLVPTTELALRVTEVLSRVSRSDNLQNKIRTMARVLQALQVLCQSLDVLIAE